MRFGGRGGPGRLAGCAASGTACRARPSCLPCARRPAARRPSQIVPAQTGTQCNVRDGARASATQVAHSRTQGVSSGLRPVSWHGVTYRRNNEGETLRRMAAALPVRGVGHRARARPSYLPCAPASAPRISPSYRRRPVPSAASAMARHAKCTRVARSRRTLRAVLGRPVSWHRVMYRRNDERGALRRRWLGFGCLCRCGAPAPRRAVPAVVPAVRTGQHTCAAARRYLPCVPASAPRISLSYRRRPVPSATSGRGSQHDSPERSIPGGVAQDGNGRSAILLSATLP